MDYSKYLIATPQDHAGEYYVLRIPKELTPPKEKDDITINGVDLVVFDVSTPEEIGKGRGGPVAKSMIADGIGWDVNCLPKGHKYLNVDIGGKPMKHLTAIQTEFFKEAAKWQDLSRETQRTYLKEHPKSKRRLTSQPEGFAPAGKEREEFGKGELAADAGHETTPDTKRVKIFLKKLKSRLERRLELLDTIQQKSPDEYEKQEEVDEDIEMVGRAVQHVENVLELVDKQEFNLTIDDMSAMLEKFEKPEVQSDKEDKTRVTKPEEDLRNKNVIAKIFAPDKIFNFKVRDKVVSFVIDDAKSRKHKMEITIWPSGQTSMFVPNHKYMTKGILSGSDLANAMKDWKTKIPSESKWSEVLNIS